MSWKDNRRRKRVWYRHYKELCEKLLALVNAGEPGSNVIAGEAIIKMFFELYESRRMHKRRRVAESAWESFELAARDSGLDKITLQPRVYTNTARPPARGEFGAMSRGGVAPKNILGVKVYNVSFDQTTFQMPRLTDEVRAAISAEIERRARDAEQATKDKEVPF